MGSWRIDWGCRKLTQLDLHNNLQTLDGWMDQNRNYVRVPRNTQQIVVAIAPPENSPAIKPPAVENWGNFLRTHTSLDCRLCRTISRRPNNITNHLTHCILRCGGAPPKVMLSSPYLCEEWTEAPAVRCENMNGVIRLSIHRTAVTWLRCSWTSTNADRSARPAAWLVGFSQLLGVPNKYIHMYGCTHRRVWSLIMW